MEFPHLLVLSEVLEEFLERVVEVVQETGSWFAGVFGAVAATTTLGIICRVVVSVVVVAAGAAVCVITSPSCDTTIQQSGEHCGKAATPALMPHTDMKVCTGGSLYFWM